MAVLHIAGNFQQYHNPIGTSWLTDTSSSTRQVANSRFSLRIRNGSSVALSPAWSLATSEFWFHAVTASAGQSAGSTGLPWLTFYDSTSGVGQLRLIHTGTNNIMQFEYWDGATWTSVGSTFTMTAGVRYRLDIHVKFHASLGEINVFLDESTALTYAGALVTPANQCDQHLFESTSSGSTSDKYWSEVYVAQDDTTGSNVCTCYVTGDGTTTGWTGDYTLIDETILDPDDIIATDTANAIHTFAVTNLPTGPDAQDILAVALFIAGNVDQSGSLADIQPVIRHSGTNYAGSSLGFGDGMETIIATYTTNPGTSVAWTASDVNNMEVGIKAV